MEKKNIRSKEAAKMLGVCKATLHRWETLGFIKSNRTPVGHRLYNLEDLMSFVNKIDSGGFNKKEE